MHEYHSPALKRLNCLLSEMDAAYHEAAQRQGQNDSTSRILYALCELGSPASLRAVCESTGLSKQTVTPPCASSRRTAFYIWSRPARGASASA